jgi:hypothetical protein
MGGAQTGLELYATQLIFKLSNNKSRQPEGWQAVLDPDRARLVEGGGKKKLNGWWRLCRNCR